MLREVAQGSAELLERARGVMPGGVSSPVRAFQRVGGEPFFVARGEGARLFDEDGRAYIDLVMSWGALMLGHAHPAIVRAVTDAAARGTSYGASTALEVELAETIRDALPSMERIRFVNSGTEATMSAVRLARAATGRRLVLKFTGCYHGHADGFLVQAGSGVATLGLPDSPGVPAEIAGLTLAVRYNDLDAVRDAFARRGDDIACIIVEPFVGNAGFIAPRDGFLDGLREIADAHGALLIFDEVMTGFRVAPGGAQARTGVRPDLTTLGKVIGGGLPVGAYGGRADLMQRIAPEGPVYQAGTLSGNPLAMAAGLAQLRSLRESNPYHVLERRARRILDALSEAAAAHGVPFTGDSAGAMFGFFFHPGPVHDYETARESNTELFARFFRACLRRGLFLAPSPFEALFLSTAHEEAVVHACIGIVREAMEEAVQ